MRTFRITTIWLVVFILVACAASQVKTTKTTSYKGLYAAGVTYKTGMETIAELQRDGLVGVETRAKVNKIANVYHDAYHIAVESLKAYAQSGNEEDFDDLQTQLIAVGKALGQLMSYINPILAENGKEILQ